MPRAAWCSQCGAFVWVGTDGSCQNGHGPECLTGTYDAYPAPGYASGHGSTPVAHVTGVKQRVSAWVMAPLIVLALALAGVVGLAAYAANQPDHPRTVASPIAEQPSPPEPAEPESGEDTLVPQSPAPSEADSAALAASVRTTTDPDIAAPALDTFIARQYPGYRVVKRISFPDQWEDGRLFVDYLLQSNRRPEFRLLVSITQARPGDAERELDWPCYQVGDVLTDDEVFSADAHEQYPYLTEKYQNATIDAYLPHSPARDAFAYGAHVLVATEDTISFSLDAGPGGLESAMRDSGGLGRWYVEAHVERGASAPRVEVMDLGE